MLSFFVKDSIVSMFNRYRTNLSRVGHEPVFKPSYWKLLYMKWLFVPGHLSEMIV